jgi:8-oxo-dGTP diphosphatase
MNRPRAFAAIFKNNQILMTKHDYPDKTFWTLPGGGLETGETFEEAVIREVREEVNLNVKVVGFLFSGQYSGGEERCYLVQLLDDLPPKLGYDPELCDAKQTLTEVKWFPIEEMKNDFHVSRVIEAMKITL